MKLLATIAGSVLAAPLVAVAGDTIRAGNPDELSLAIDQPRPARYCEVWWALKWLVPFASARGDTARILADPPPRR